MLIREKKTDKMNTTKLRERDTKNRIKTKWRIYTHT